MPSFSKYALVRFGNSVEMRESGLICSGLVIPLSLGTASTTLTGRSVCFEYSRAVTLTTSAPVSAIQSSPVTPMSKNPSST
jgi:hypothetical protein